MKNPTIHVALSRSQIHEILFAIEAREYASEELRQARITLQRAVREPRVASNQETQRKTA